MQKELPHKNKIIFVGKQPDDILQKAYAAADVFVMPNIPIEGDMEGFGIVLLEANLASTPAVAADLEGIKDVVENGKNGYKIPVRDSEAFASKIDETLNMNYLALSNSSRNYVIQNFAWNRVAERYISYLNKVIELTQIQDTSTKFDRNLILAILNLTLDHTHRTDRMGETNKLATQDIFSKAFNFTKADEVKALGLYPYFKPLEATDGTIVEIEGHEVIMAGSNNYLGLTNDFRTIQAAQDALNKYGTGCTGSRYLNGTLDIHIELEEKLASFMGKESCVLFSTGYQTNEGSIQTIAGRNDLIFSDRDNHACIVVGTQVSNAKTIRYRHNDMDQLRKFLEAADPELGKVIVSDGVFSMSGTLAKVPELVSLAKEFGARLYLDDAHAVGVVGDGGRGSASVFGLTDQVDLISWYIFKIICFFGRFSSWGSFCN